MTFLPERDRVYLMEKNLPYEEKEAGGQRGVVFPGYRVPLNRFDATQADLLIILPAGYPDAPPDMFYLLPWLRLAASNGFPKAADVPHPFDGKSWQRWSRHNGEWRPGVDGIWTMLKRVNFALECAAA